MALRDSRAKKRDLSPVWRRKVLFAALYFSEGAPIAFIWLVIPVQLRFAGLPVERITWLQSVLILPWALKFLWAPLVDHFRSERWTFRHWIYSAQTMMGLTLLPLFWLDFVRDFKWLATALLLHAVSAATQDVSIDALCIATTTKTERGGYNGWMNVGMLLGRAAMGGGLLAIYPWVGQTGAVGTLLLATLFSMAVLASTRLPQEFGATPNDSPAYWSGLVWTFRRVFTSPVTWQGVSFVLVAGAAFKSFDAVYSIYLVDRGFTDEQIGLFTAGPVIGAQVVGSILGGWLTDRLGAHRLVRISLVAIAALIAGVAIYDLGVDGAVAWPQLVLMTVLFLGIGIFTAGSYALYMNWTQTGITATQFSTFMGAVNGSESWSVYVLGLLITSRGYGEALLIMAALSLLALPLLARSYRANLDVADDRAINSQW